MISVQPGGETALKALRASRLSGATCRSGRPGRPGGATSGAWDELFQPSRQHVREEKERRLALRDDVESGAPPRSTVDLHSGLAVIRPEPRHGPGQR
ncbi:DUF6191 domain-containing protein [Streptomyces sp. NPDC048637]|uniref:DUF6191 domain-containing protein n=1 Tax=Streptomyces sp. NPDC048637 TaxID=3155636 RepID=UPI003412C588